MHKKVTWNASRLRTQKRRKFEKHKFPNLEIGDFVLLPKLRPKLTGPDRVVETI
jgi:hypothetical protein